MGYYPKAGVTSQPKNSTASLNEVPNSVYIMKYEAPAYSYVTRATRKGPRWNRSSLAVIEPPPQKKSTKNENLEGGKLDRYVKGNTIRFYVVSVMLCV